MKLRNAILGTMIIALSAVGMLWLAPTVEAVQSVPNKYVYNGHLLDSSGNAVTSAVKIRFSFWTSQDFVAGNVTSTGAIHEAAATYAGYQEVFTVTPNSDGYFSVDLGSSTSLPAIDNQSLSTTINNHD